ncbi:MAG TPA: hypothetical protein VGR07_11560 [Thermoanaerobaculia bacterium]|jgi:hypothetical protein|nr:hypothetical protein [Thermoanaerobaculia bacterium]
MPAGAGRRLRLPVLAGLRQGFLDGELTAEPVPGGARLSFRVEGSEYRLRTTAVSCLVVGGIGGLALILWPLYPPLLRLAPLGVVLALAAWFLVLSRLRVSGPEEFLDMVSAISGGAGEPEDVDGNPDEGPPGL